MCELDRAVHVQDAAGRLPGGHAGDEPTLLRLATTAGQPWAGQLEDHRQALTALAEEVADGLRTTRRLAEAGTGALDALLDRVGARADPPPALLTYGPGSATSWSAPAPRLRTTR